jgi:hypothetical protein
VRTEDSVARIRGGGFDILLAALKPEVVVLHRE